MCPLLDFSRRPDTQGLFHKGFRVEGLGFRVESLFRILGLLGLRVEGFGFGALGFGGVRVQSLGFPVWGC